ncbi:MAG TPA: hypothetical protein P5157_06575 [Paludibacteraceae bacterium]|nr:MAG: hypothetical protein BWZ11_00334 [Bacteroidetes bacterium ADurb.BinA395]HOF98284.1 hypothetical protein [Paludibacteraceae bacterium]HOL28833.1 hypothetical protein [Paludibacteraceae bacterium]HON02167.1 hypothetical protein [Paludibacteraceae bacterium]HPD58878.1 hypothetical protein [Paludibacteraceae bacterium]
MSKFMQKIPIISAIFLVSVSVILVLLIYVGGTSGSINNSAGEAMSVPRFTDALIYWSYFLVGLAVVITLGFVVKNFFQSSKQSSSSIFKSLLPIIGFILLFVVSWLLGSDQELKIIGYEGAENVGFWSRFTDMMIFPIYVMAIGIILTIIGTSIYSSLRKD